MEQIAPLEIGIPVRDLARMLDFYSAVLSCTEVRRADIPAALSCALTTAVDGYTNVWLQTPNGEVIKLMAPPSPPERAVLPTFLSERTGIAYLTLYCRNIEQVLASAESQGAVLRSERSTLSGAIGLKLCFFEDPEGNIIELVEPAA